MSAEMLHFQTAVSVRLHVLIGSLPRFGAGLEMQQAGGPEKTVSSSFSCYTTVDRYSAATPPRSCHCRGRPVA